MTGYLVQVDHRTFCRRGGEPFSLVAALTEVRGVGNARVLRSDGTPVVTNAGSDCGPLVHTPTGRTVHRRKTRRRTS